jgi:hypothetical protein
MRAEDVSWGSGKVVFWDLEFLDAARPLQHQLDDLKEDLAQAEYGPDRVLDIGWYPSFSEDGRFVVRVVVTSDWEAPLFLEEAATAAELLQCLPRAVAAAEAAAG